MAFEMHTVEVPSGLDGFSRSDRAILGLVSIPYPAEAAGTSASVTITFAEPLQTPFDVFFSASADVTAYVTAQTPLSFTVSVQPRLAANPLVAGTIGALIVN
jgi:hypothetical protein